MCLKFKQVVIKRFAYVSQVMLDIKVAEIPIERLEDVTFNEDLGLSARRVGAVEEVRQTAQQIRRLLRRATDT